MNIRGVARPALAQDFLDLHGRVENALRNVGYLKKIDRAEADWSELAKALGEDFFKEVRDSGIALTLIAERPRKQMAANLDWQPPKALQVTNTQELFVNGVCQVRNHIAHHQKFRGSQQEIDRDMKLVEESYSILELLLKKRPDLTNFL